MSSRDFIERLEKHGHGMTDAIKSARRSDPELAENLNREWSGFLRAMSDCLEDMRGILQH